jgi:hypothetical protein
VLLERRRDEGHGRLALNITPNPELFCGTAALIPSSTLADGPLDRLLFNARRALVKQLLGMAMIARARAAYAILAPMLAILQIRLRPRSRHLFMYFIVIRVSGRIRRWLLFEVNRIAIENGVLRVHLDWTSLRSIDCRTTSILPAGSLADASRLFSW